MLRQCEDRLAILNASHIDAFLALSRGQAALRALERRDPSTATAASAPAQPAPVDQTAWRIRELKTRLYALQREHERLRRSYEELRARQLAAEPAPAPDLLRPQMTGGANGDTRLAQGAASGG